MTLTVAPLGERFLWKHFWSRAVVYCISAMVSGAMIGFILVIIVYLLSFWMSYAVKNTILLILALLYLLREFHLISVLIPQCHWQIPTYWVDRSPLKNLTVWGLVLGAGVFTYNPYFAFYLMYLYAGLYFSPPVGLMAGAIYGFCRCLPTLFIAAKRYWQPDTSIDPNWNSWQAWLHKSILLLVVIYALYYLNT